MTVGELIKTLAAMPDLTESVAIAKPAEPLLVDGPSHSLYAPFVSRFTPEDGPPVVVLSDEDLSDNPQEPLLTA